MPILVAYITVVLLWGTTPLAVQWSIESVDVVFALGARTLIGLIFTYIWMRWHGKSISFEPTAIKLYLISLLGTVGAMSAIYWASRFIASGLISVLFGLAPICGGVCAAMWLNERIINRYRLLGIVTALLGLAVVFQQELSLGSESWKGVLGVIIGVVLYSISSVWIKRLGGNYSSLSVNTGSLLVTFIVLLTIWLASGGQIPTDASTRSMAAIAYLGVFGSFIGFVAYYYVLRSMQTASAMLITLVSPIIALYLGAIFNNEQLSIGVLTGSLLVLAGLVLYLGSALKTVLIIIVQKIRP